MKKKSEKQSEIMTMGMDEVLSLTDLVVKTSGVNCSSLIGRDLIELVNNRLEGKNDYKFRVCYDEEYMEYKESRYFENGSDYWKTIRCCEPGWNWMRFTGPREVMELNYSSVCTFEATTFVNSYLLYTAITRQGVDFHTLYGEDVVAKINELFSAEELMPEIEEFEYEEDEEVRRYRAITWVYGARYIECKLNDIPMDERDMEKLEAYYEKAYGAFHVDAKKYYDSFFTIINDYNFDKEELKEIFPFLLDVCFGMKVDCAYDVTPTLYVYSSEVLSEYQKVREQYQNSPYIPYLDKLKVLLEDPVAVRQFSESDAYYETDVLGMIFAEDFSARFAYMNDSYIAIYYFFENEERCLKFNPLFKAARQLFERIFTQMKKEGVSVA